MNILLWQWGRFGGAPRVAAALAQGLSTLEDVKVLLSMANASELMQSAWAPKCDLPVNTYRGHLGFLWRLATVPLAARSLARRITELHPDVAVCAQTGPLDLLMARALAHLRIPMVVLVHDAELHPGDGQPFQIQLQRALCRRAAALGALSSHVAAQLVAQRLAGGASRPLIQLHLPPLPIVLPSVDRQAGDGAFHLLSFGRLLPYKGLDMLGDALAQLSPEQTKICVRVVGFGPESPELRRLRTLPNVTVENRWVPETELGKLLAWSDALVLPYREASQSGVAALALAAGRRVVATRVGGLPEQLGGEPLATLCAPDAASLTQALSDLVGNEPRAKNTAPVDAFAAWQEVAAELVRQLKMVVSR